jgi:membrane-anchored protein YejM (alkaline phosphatase superfamily)
MKKIYLATIGIVGEEAYKIFSKSYQNKAEEIDSNVLEEIEADEGLENTLDAPKK